jgi:DNA-binding CsgD family transcriptional regulator
MKSGDAGLRKGFGLVGVLIQAGMAIADLAEPDELSSSPVHVLFALLFLATALVSFLGALQAALFFGLSAVETVSSLDSIYGLGFAAVGAIILFRRGCFVRRPMAKAPVVAGLGCAILALPILFSRKPAVSLAPALVSAAVFASLVFGLAGGRLLSAFAPAKPILSLADYRLGRRERQVVKARIQGKTVKEIAAENGLAVSTVRNALSTACRKLGIEGREALAALGERYRVE